jgi:hypothetical protein
VQNAELPNAVNEKAPPFRPALALCGVINEGDNGRSDASHAAESAASVKSKPPYTKVVIRDINSLREDW